MVNTKAIDKYFITLIISVSIIIINVIVIIILVMSFFIIFLYKNFDISRK